jgi:hypothetical protein
MNFITEESLQSEVIIWIVISAALVVIFGFITKRLDKTDSIFFITVSLLISIMSAASLLVAGTAYLVYGGNPTTSTYNTQEFKEWVLDEYRIELDDKQAELLLKNTFNKEKPSSTDAVYITTFDGKDALATLFHEKDEWRLIVTESIAVPSN